MQCEDVDAAATSVLIPSCHSTMGDVAGHAECQQTTRCVQHVVVGVSSAVIDDPVVDVHVPPSLVVGWTTKCASPVAAATTNGNRPSLSVVFSSSNDSIATLTTDSVDSARTSALALPMMGVSASVNREQAGCIMSWHPRFNHRPHASNVGIIWSVGAIATLEFAAGEYTHARGWMITPCETRRNTR